MTPLNEQLRNAADDCTPSPLKDLLNRAADAVDVKQDPVATVKDLMLSKFNPLVYERGFDMNAPLYTHPAPIPDGMMLVPVEPTREMVIAGEDAWLAQLEARLDAKMDGSEFAEYPSEETHALCSRIAYRAMLKAAGESS